jgi:hypothetical protein
MKRTLQLLLAIAMLTFAATSAMAASADSSRKLNKEPVKPNMNINTNEKKAIAFTCPVNIKLKTQGSAAPSNMTMTGNSSLNVDWLQMTFDEWIYKYNNTTKTTEVYSVYCITSAPKNGMTCQTIYMAFPKGPWKCKPSGNTLNCQELSSLATLNQ